MCCWCCHAWLFCWMLCQDLHFGDFIIGVNRVLCCDCCLDVML